MFTVHFVRLLASSKTLIRKPFSAKNLGVERLVVGSVLNYLIPKRPARVSILNKCILVLENRRDDASNVRHQVEEEMTKAVLRYCAQCKHGPFEKDEGCNRITCPNCGYQQCYACGSGFVNYEDHYGEGKPCELFENTPERLMNEAAAAQERFVREVIEKEPALRVEDVLVDESLFQRGLNIWRNLPRVPLHPLYMNGEEADRPHWDIEEAREAEEVDPHRQHAVSLSPGTIVFGYHCLHLFFMICVAGFTGKMIDSLDNSALLNFAAFTLMWSFITKSFPSLWGLDLIFSFSVSMAMSVETSQGVFSIIQMSFRD